MNNDNDLNLHNMTKLSGWLHYCTKLTCSCSGSGKHEVTGYYFRILNVTRAITRDLAREFLLKSVVLGLISNEISWAEHSFINIYPPPQLQQFSSRT